MAKMGRPTSQESLAIMQRRKKVADLYVRGMSQYAIADEIGVSREVVLNDLNQIRKQWMQAMVMDMNVRKSQELAKLDAIEAAAWASWMKSLQNEEVLTDETVRGRVNKDGQALPEITRSSKRISVQCGDPRFLEKILECIERRCRLLGLDAPMKDELHITIDERRDRLDRLLETLRQRAGASGSGIPADGAEAN